jgi:hypothetical protein
MNRKRVLVATTAAIACLLFAATIDLNAGKPQPTTPAQATFMLDPGVRIYGDGFSVDVDGNSVYDNGINKVAAQIYSAAGASQDFTLNLVQTTSPERWVTLDFSDPVPPSLPPSGVLADASFVNIGRIYECTVASSPCSFTASFNTSVGYIRFFGVSAAGFTSDLVQVTATQDSYPRKWEVTAAPGSDIAVLYRNIKGRFTPTGAYHMPFRMIVGEK